MILAQPNQTADAAYSSELSLYIDLYLSGVIFIESAHYLYTDGSYFAYFQYGYFTSPDKLGFVAEAVIKAIARLEFEDGLRTGILPGRYLGP